MLYFIEEYLELIRKILLGYVLSIYGKEYCDTANIRESELKYIFKDIIDKLNIDLNKVVNMLLNYYEKVNINKKDENKLGEDIRRIEIKKDKLLDLKIKDLISDEEFRKRNNSFNEEIEDIKKRMKIFKRNKVVNKDIKKIIEDKVKTKKIEEKIISLLLKEIRVSKIEEKIYLDIYLNYLIEKELYINYEFKRGFDTMGTKRYIVYYEVKVSN